MATYESKQHQILLPAEQIFTIFSNFEHLTPAVADKVEEWEATPDRCSFKAKGFTVRLRMEEREVGRHIKVVPDGEDGAPVDFAFWVQMQSVAPYDTRFRLVLKAELNMMMKMMIGGKLQGAVDQLAEQIAAGFTQAQTMAATQQRP